MGMGRQVQRHASLLAVFAVGVVTALLLSTNGAGGAPEAPDFTVIVARTDASVVHVATVTDTERAAHSRDDAVGAGFVLSADGLVVTSRHILQGARRVLAEVEGRGTVVAQVVGTDDATDVALLRLPLSGLRPVAIGDPRALRKGEWVLAVGSPFHLPRSWSVGIVSGLGRSGVGTQLRGYEDFIQTDAASNVGNSGGPLLNASGQVVGMMTAILSRTGRSEGISLAVPIDIVLETARRLQTGGAVARPSLGVIVRERGARAEGGLEITRFQPASAGRAAGLRAGDVIVEVAGVSVRRTADLQRVVWAQTTGATVTVVFLRGGKRYRLPVTLR